MNILAYLAAIGKSIIFGSTFYFTGALTESVDVLDVLSLRFLLSFAVLWLLKITRVIKVDVGLKDVFTKTKRTPFIKTLLLAALFEPVLYMLFETLGVSMTTSVTSAVIVSLAPIAGVIVESLVLGERCPLIVKLFLGSGMIGAVIIAVGGGAGDGEDSIFGILFLLCSVVVTSLFSSLSRKSSFHFKPMEITYIAAMVGTVVFNAVNIVRHIWQGTILNYFDPYFDLDNLIAFFFLGVVSTIIAGSMTNYALSRLQVSIMSAFGGVSTLVTILIGVFIAGEKLYAYHYVGFAFILVRMIGVSVINIINERKIMPHESPLPKTVTEGQAGDSQSGAESISR